MLCCNRRLKKPGGLMTATQTRAMDWSVGSLFGVSTSILFRHFVPFIGIALVGHLPSLVITLTLRPAPQVLTGLNATFWELQAVGLVGTLVTLFAWVMLFYGAVQALHGRPVSIADCASRGLGRFGIAIGVVILAYLGIVAASILLIVPGIILALRWAVAVPVASVEKTGVMESLKRSAELTRGSRWRVLGAGLLYSLIVAVPIYVVIFIAAGNKGMINFMTHDLQTSTAQIVLWLIYTAYSAFGACFFATLYYFLRRGKEGVDSTVFD
jgi:hypothetical protein